MHLGRSATRRTVDGVDIAYTSFGSGPPDLVLIPGFVTHLDLMWDYPWNQAFLRYGRYTRTIVFDKRGTGLSDRSLGFGSLEERSEDVHVVMDAVGSEQAVIFGISEGGPMAIYFAALYPERVRGLILYGTGACFGQQPDFPEGIHPDAKATFLATIEEHWGTGVPFSYFVQNATDVVRAQQAMAPYERSACTRQMARQIMERNFEIDVRPFLPTISVPTLVLHNTYDPVLPVGWGRYLAEHISGATFVEMPGYFHASWQAEDMATFEVPIGEFLERLGGESHQPPADRVLATVLFTDIVGSTQRLTGAGDNAWRQILDRHDTVTAERVARFGGKLVKSTGDGALATFGGPSSAIEAARAVRDSLGSLDLEIRAGIHTGEVELRQGDVGGIAVHIGARIASLAMPGEIWVSRTVKDLVTGSGLDFEDRQEHELKGVSGSWQLYSLAG